MPLDRQRLHIVGGGDGKIGKTAQTFFQFFELRFFADAAEQFLSNGADQLNAVVENQILEFGAVCSVVISVAEGQRPDAGVD